MCGCTLCVYQVGKIQKSRNRKVQKQRNREIEKLKNAEIQKNYAKIEKYKNEKLNYMIENIRGI